MSFIPISILAYALFGGAILVDKILLRTSLPNPLVYTFYISLLGLLSLFLLPFGVNFNLSIILPGIISGIASTLALISLFQSLKLGEASVSGPVVGALNPLFTLILGAIFLNQLLTQAELLSFFTILLGASILTFNLWSRKLRLNTQLIFMILSGFCFAISYLFLKETFLQSNFSTGVIFTRIVAAATSFCFLVSKTFRKQIFASSLKSNNFLNKTSALLFFGQTMGAGGGLLLAYGVSLSSPALVNSLFGVQYLVILIVALTLYKNHPKLLDEKLTKGAIFQKSIGAAILSFGVYLLSR